MFFSNGGERILSMGLKKLSLGMVGVGQLGTALLKGLQSSKTRAQFELTLWGCNPSLPKHDLGIERITPAQYTPERWQNTDVVILGVKPKLVEAALKPMLESGFASGGVSDSQTPILVSLLAGTSLEQLEALLPEKTSIIRVMGNILWQVGQGSAGFTANNSLRDSGTNKELLLDLFRTVGSVADVSESQMDALTGYLGSGPAFLLTVWEAFLDGAVASGVPRALAQELLPCLWQGLPALLQESQEHPAVLRDRITTPAGTTMAGLKVLEAEGLRYALMEALIQATEKANAFRQGK
jgi:pyrroline-5-carboxylate reductase